MVSFKIHVCLFYTQLKDFCNTCKYIFNGRKQTLVDTIGILSALRMRGLHDKRHLLAKLRIAGSKNCFIGTYWHSLAIMSYNQQTKIILLLVVELIQQSPGLPDGPNNGSFYQTNLPETSTKFIFSFRLPEIWIT